MSRISKLLEEALQFKKGDRVKSKLDGREGTVWSESGQAGSTQCIVKFDNPKRKAVGFETETILVSKLELIV